MADIALTAAQIHAIDPTQAEIYNFVAAEAITQGQAVYFVTTGTVGVADANAAGKQQCRGIALNAAAAGQAVSVLKKGRCAGFTVSSVNCGAGLYLSDTAGALADAAGTLEVPVGSVVPMSDKDKTRVAYIDARWRQPWA